MGFSPVPALGTYTTNIPYRCSTSSIHVEITISELSSTKAQVQTSSVSPAKTRLTREEKGKTKMFEEDKPQASLQSKCDSVASGDQRSLRVGLSKSELDDKTKTKASTDGAFSIKLANAFSALDGASDIG